MENKQIAIIPINFGVMDNDLKQMVNARDLHAFLEVGKDFSNWIKNRIEKYDFEEGRDFIIFIPQNHETRNGEVFARFGENPSGGRPSIEYHLSLDMAKEIAMVERNERGKQVRRYFIECEKQLREGGGLTVIPRAELEELKGEVRALAARMPAKRVKPQLTEDEEKIDKIKQIIRKKGGRMAHSQLLRVLHNSLRAYELRELLQAMMGADQIKQYETKPARGPKRVEYRLH